MAAAMVASMAGCKDFSMAARRADGWACSRGETAAQRRAASSVETRDVAKVAGSGCRTDETKGRREESCLAEPTGLRWVFEMVHSAAADSDRSMAEMLGVRLDKMMAAHAVSRTAAGSAAAMARCRAYCSEDPTARPLAVGSDMQAAAWMAVATDARSACETAACWARTSGRKSGPAMDGKVVSSTAVDSAARSACGMAGAMAGRRETCWGGSWAGYWGQPPAATTASGRAMKRVLWRGCPMVPEWGPRSVDSMGTATAFPKAAWMDCATAGCSVGLMVQTSAAQTGGKWAVWTDGPQVDGSDSMMAG